MRFFLALTLLLMISAGDIFAEEQSITPVDMAGDKGDSESPLEVTSDRMVSDKKNNKISFYGSVIATKGKLKVNSTEMVVHTTDDQSDFKKIEAFGNVIITRGEKTATGDTAIYYTEKEMIELIGNPVLQDGQNRATGEKVIYYFDREDMVIIGSAEKRSTLTLFPTKKKEEEKIPEKGKATVTFPPKPAKEEKKSDDKPEEVTPEEVTPAETTVEEVPEKQETIVEAPVTIDEITEEDIKPQPKQEVEIMKVEEIAPVKKETTPETVTQDDSFNDAADKTTQFYTIHVASYENTKSAARVYILLKKREYAVYMAPVNEEGNVVYNVRIGKYENREMARKMVDHLKNNENLDSSVIDYNLSH